MEVVVLPGTSVRMGLLNGRSYFEIGGERFFMLAVSIRVDRWWLAWEREGLAPSERWERLESMIWIAKEAGFNTISLPLLWRWIEPAPAHYDLEWLDRYAALARKSGLAINLLWFGQNYAGENYAGGAADSSGQSLVPDYIYGDESFQRVIDRRGNTVTSRPDRELFALCPGGRRLLDRELAAFTRIYRAAAKHNRHAPVFLCLQVENDPALAGTDRCHCPQCDRAWSAWAEPGLTPLDFTNWQFARVIGTLTSAVDGAGPAMTILCNARHTEDDIGIYLTEAPNLAGVGLGVFDYSLEDCLRRRGGLLRSGYPGFIAENGVAFNPLANMYKALGQLGLAGFGVYQLVDDPFFYPAMVINEGLYTPDLRPRALVNELRPNLHAISAALTRRVSGIAHAWSFGPEQAGEVLRFKTDRFNCLILTGGDSHGMVLCDTEGELIVAGQHFVLEIPEDGGRSAAIRIDVAEPYLLDGARGPDLCLDIKQPAAAIVRAAA